MGKAYAFRYSWQKEEAIEPLLEQLLKDSQISQVEALTFGMLQEDVFETSQSQYIVDYLVNAKDKLTNLKAIFIGDITQDESEISWITHTNISPVLSAYPNLELLQIRGGEGLGFSPIQHDKLQALIIETGGLSKDTIADISKLQLPNLQHLELWLGSEYYGGNSTVEDLNWIMSGNVSENLIYLGLRNSEYSDEIVAAIAKFPILERIRILDISMGTLTDEGANTLLKCSAIDNLDILNISENYLSQKIVESLQKLNIRVITDKQKDEDEDERYCSVSE
ncbi:conserved hypothetical protein [Hyella patelloides LEGE 07179]|uniref:Uncharacterized protein n=1 Tax=Hyella patelloides LEGE 07179 TaxID=945734 RepID=A0A563W2S0_9CYAN|nr:STM4015 family protein [Hyella patelloides]VEP17950.1 conserved hypothetical protein [Hyella patelloides LEGE 07179]